MVAELSYGGKGLVYDRLGEKGDEQLREFIDRYQPPADLIVDALQGPHAQRWHNNVSGEKNAVTLALPNWPDRTPLKINQLYWPSGATRWAIGLFLCDQTTAFAIEQSLGTAQTLKMSDGINTPAISVSMYALAPRPINLLSRGQTLYLLPLVDERYYWQQKHVAGVTLDDESDWTLGGDLGISTAITVGTVDIQNAAYGIPDNDELGRDYENAAAMLDAVAWSTGRRIVRRMNGTTYIERPDTAAPLVVANLADQKNAIAGGSIAPAPVPATVRCVFPRLCDHIPLSHLLYAKDKTPTGAAASLPTVADTFHVVHSTAWARVTAVASLTSTPVNETFLDTLAAQIAADYYAWRAKAFDVTFQGAKAWVITGFDDHVLYTFGRLHCGQHVVTTRAVSLPPNVAACHNLSQDDENVVLRGMQMGVADENITRSSPGDVKIITKASGSYAYQKDVSDVQVMVTAGAYSINTDQTVEDDTAVYVQPFPDGHWEIIGGNCDAKDWTLSGD